MAYFQELIPHWSLTFHSNGLQHHGGLGLSFPKWYDTCIFVEKWPHNRPKPGEISFWSKFWQNFRGLFGALKTLFWCNQRYGWMPPYWYSRFLTSKTNLENLIFPIPNSCPLTLIIVVNVVWFNKNFDPKTIADFAYILHMKKYDMGENILKNF